MNLEDAVVSKKIRPAGIVKQRARTKTQIISHAETGGTPHQILILDAGQSF